MEILCSLAYWLKCNYYRKTGPEDESNRIITEFMVRVVTDPVSSKQGKCSAMTVLIRLVPYNPEFTTLAFV